MLDTEGVCSNTLPTVQVDNGVRLACGEGHIPPLGVGGVSPGRVDGMQNESQPDYLGRERVAYEHDDLKLRILQETVRLGDTIEFEVTNTSDTEIGLGADNPWAIQQYADGEWQHVTWTSAKYHQFIGTVLFQGASLVESIELSKSGLEGQADEVPAELRPGRYRYLLLGPSPYLAVDFDVLDPE